MEEGRSAFTILTGKPTGKRSLEGLGVDVRTILECTLKEMGINTRNWIDLTKVGVIAGPLCMRHLTSGFHKPWSLLYI